MKNILLLACFVATLSCKEATKKIENPLESELIITADESVQPIIDAQIMSYQAHYPEAKIIIKYVPEQKAMNLMMNDSADIAVATREMNAEELAFLKKKGIPYLPAKMALDGVTLVVNPNSSISKISFQELKDMLEGKSTNGMKLVFDNSSSSNLNVLISQLNVEKLSNQNIFSANGNLDVIEHIKKNTNSIGVIGNNWISDDDDHKAQARRNSVKILAISKDGMNYYTPTSDNLKARKYPLERKIILHTKEHYGVAKGFTRFCCAQIGQLVVDKAGLLPYYIYDKEMIMEKKSVQELQVDEKAATEKIK